MFSLEAVPYQAPSWVRTLKNVPTSRLQLAHENTPIHEWRLPGVDHKKFNVFIKRDDMTGSATSGNKIRKLEFLLADAISKGCKHIFTAGAIQSNHCRQTALAACHAGFRPHLFLRYDGEISDLACNGNLLLDRLCGSEIYLVGWNDKFLTQIKPKMEAMAEKIRNETGEKSYLIPVGGSDAVGMYGYIYQFEEILRQGGAENFTDIVVAAGSGGTLVGLAIANYLAGNPFKVHGVAICDNSVADGPQFFYEFTNGIMREIGLEGVDAKDIMEIIDGHRGIAYAVSNMEELNFITDVGAKTGVLLDPVYSGKSAKGLVYELNHNPSRFMGNKILFIHTGGVFGLMDGRMDACLKQENQSKHIRRI